MCRNLSKAKSCETQCEYSRDNIHEDNMMRDLKCSYCKHNLAYVSKMQTINQQMRQLPRVQQPVNITVLHTRKKN